jgi:4-hydroxybenzoate polyprenyltransferase
MSNLPTVWSDCLAAWCLGGQGSTAALALVTLAASFLYVGGMFLNDAFDAAFDRDQRRNRPIPSGAISERAVWRWGFVWLALGLASAVALGLTTLMWAAALSACILLYNAVHKWTPLGPFLMGLCRLGLYLLAASTARRGISGEVVWKGLALAAYIVGLSCLARKESSRVRINFWPSLLLATPVVFAGLIDNDSSWMPAVIYSLVVAAWTSWAMSRSVGQSEPNIGQTVSRLLAGIVLLDMLAVASGNHWWITCFAVWFVLAMLLQRFIPAT